MTEKYRVHELGKYNYSDIGEYVDEDHTDNPLRNDEVCRLLNELSEENEQLKQEIDELDEKYEILEGKYYNCKQFR